MPEKITNFITVIVVMMVSLFYIAICVEKEGEGRLWLILTYGFIIIINMLITCTMIRLLRDKSEDV